MNPYKFGWKGRDPQGNVRSEEIMAENAQAAREELTQSGWTELDLVEGLILLTESYLCAVHGASGNLTEARKLFRATKPFLKAHREDELLQACRSVT